MARILNGLRAITLATVLVGAGPAFAGTVSSGAQTFKSDCAVCHHDTQKAPPSVGPNLFGVVGRKAGSLPGYAYSPAMKRSGLTWTPDELKLYLASPAKVVPGNKMPFMGVHDSSRLDAVLSYLETLK